MYIDQAFVCRSGHYQKPFSFVTAFEWCTSDRRHKYWLAIGAVDEIWLLLVAFLFPKPAIGKADSTPMLPEGLNILLVAAVSTRAFISGWLIPPPGCIAPEYRVKMQLFVAFAQQQNFRPGATL
jgi:hypothetical protein